MVDLVRLKKFEDERGLLVVQESEVPFVIKRTFWIYGKKNELRGGHGHFRTKLALIAITGSIDIDVASKKSQKIYTLDAPDVALLIDPFEWHSMSFAENSTLLVLASSNYDEKDYFYERPGPNDSV